MKILIGFLSAVLSISAYAGVTIVDNSKENKQDIKISGTNSPGADKFMWLYFQNFNQALLDKGIPQMAITIERYNGTDGNYSVYANSYTEVNNVSVVSTSGCEVTLNGTSINSAILSDQCY